MAFVVDEDTGDITLVQGDSGEITINGLPIGSNYTVYFAFYNDKREIIGQEVSMQTNSASVITMFIPASLTDLLTVKKNEDSAEYYYGIKICNSLTGSEETLCINNSDIGALNTVTVYPKKVEGII